VANNPQRAQLPLQRKTKPARFINRMYFGSSLLKFGRPVQERLLSKSLRRLGIGSTRLLDHHIKILVYINPKLIAPVLRLNSKRVSSCEDNSV
jgi:hypothetical protein